MNIKEILKQNRGKTDIESITFIIEDMLKKLISEKGGVVDEEMAKIKDNLIKWTESAKKEVEKIAQDYIKTQIVNGKDGYTPRKGVDYTDGHTPRKGSDYFDGKDGKNGKDGYSPEINYDKIIVEVVGQIGEVKDKPNEVVEKVISSKELIPLSKIKGLKTELDKMIVAFREARGGGSTQSGGGMGKWVHQQFNLTAVTSSITLSNNISAGGTAHLFRYQGQMLAMNVDYTVSGKVVSLLFTPVDGTVFDATYVRS